LFRLQLGFPLDLFCSKLLLFRRVLLQTRLKLSNVFFALLPLLFILELAFRLLESFDLSDIVFFLRLYLGKFIFDVFQALRGALEHGRL
jgi:hypothetical protein